MTEDEVNNLSFKFNEFMNGENLLKVSFHDFNEIYWRMVNYMQLELTVQKDVDDTIVKNYKLNGKSY